jgi:hypothetical protein
LFMHCIDMLHVMQIAELNDERNWRSGLRVQLLNTCMVTICWILSITMRWFSLPIGVNCFFK